MSLELAAGRPADGSTRAIGEAEGGPRCSWQAQPLPAAITTKSKTCVGHWGRVQPSCCILRRVPAELFPRDQRQRACHPPRHPHQLPPCHPHHQSGGGRRLPAAARCNHRREAEPALHRRHSQEQRADRTLVPGPRCPEVPDEGVQFLPDCNRLVARVTLLKRLFVLHRSSHVQALAEIGIGIDVVQPVVALLGDERSPRSHSTQIRELLWGVGELHLEAGGRQELLRPLRRPRIVHEAEGLHLHPIGRARVRDLEVEEGSTGCRDRITHRLDHALDRASRRVELADPKLDIRRVMVGLVVDVADDSSLALAARPRGPLHSEEAIGKPGTGLLVRHRRHVLGCRSGSRLPRHLECRAE
jgi:hypothetical protein